MTVAIKSREPKSLLKTKKYFLFWISSLLSNIGTWMQQVAEPWVMLTISHSSFLVGVDSFALNAPGWLFTLWGGELADKFDRKKIIIFFQSIQFVAIIIMVIFLAFDLLKPWIIILVSIIVGTTDALSTPAIQTIIPSMIDEKEIPKAVSLNAIQFNLSRILGPVIAGIVMMKYGALTTFGLNAFSYVPFFLSMFWIFPRKIKIAKAVISNEKQPTLKLVLKEFFLEKNLRHNLISVFVTMLFCSPLITFSPVLIKDTFRGEIKDYGEVSTGFGVGGLIGALLIYFIASKVKFKKSPSVYGLFSGLAVFAVSFIHSISLLIYLMVFAGIFISMAHTSSSTSIQSEAQKNVRGRYASIYQLAFRGGLSLGALLTGLLAEYSGIEKALMINGVLAISIHLLTLFI